MQCIYSTSEYIKIPDTINILDQRHLGYGKSTEGLQLLDYNVRHGKASIVVMRSYDNLREMYNRLDRETRDRAIIFQGKPQPGMCEFSDELEKMKNIIPSFISCRGCGDFTCGYQAQKKEIDDLKKTRNEKNGLVIFTVSQNLPYIIKDFFRTQRLTIIIDDNSLSEILMSPYITTKKNVEAATEFLEKNSNPDASLLVEVSKRLVTDSPKATLEFVKENEKEIYSQYKCLGYHLYKLIQNEGIQGIPSFHYLYHLTRASYVRINHPIGPSNIIIYTSNKSLIERSRVIFISGTPTVIDKNAMESLGPFQSLKKDAPHNDNLVVLQYRRAKYTRETLLNPDSDALPKTLSKQLRRIYRALEFIGAPLLVMMDTKAYEKRYEEVISSIVPNHEFVPFFSRNANSTNQYRDVPITFIIGTPIKPPVAYMDPFLEPNWIEEDELRELVQASKETRERTGHSKAVYPVPSYIIENDTMGQVIQMTGRTHRRGNNPDAPKLVVVFNQAEISDESGHVPLTGAKEITVDNEDELDRNFYKYVKPVLEPLIMEKALQIIELRLASGIEVGLTAVSEEFSQRVGGVVSKRSLERQLREVCIVGKAITAQNRTRDIITGIKPKLGWGINNTLGLRPNMEFGPIIPNLQISSLYNNSDNQSQNRPNLVAKLEEGINLWSNLLNQTNSKDLLLWNERNLTNLATIFS